MRSRFPPHHDIADDDVRPDADDSVANLEKLMTRRSLEEVFAQLVLREDPERTARDIASVVVDRA